MKHRKIREADVWDGWAPSEDEMRQRLAKIKPERQFWQDWDQERIESIEELRDAFQLRCAGSLVMAFDIERMPHYPSAAMSGRDQGIYRRFRDWLEEVHHAKLKRYIPMVQGVLVREDTCPDRTLFARAIDLHVRICRKEIRRHLLVRRERTA